MLIKVLFVYCVIGSVLTGCVLAWRSLSVFDGMSWREVAVSVVFGIWTMPVACVLLLAKGLRILYQYHKQKKS